MTFTDYLVRCGLTGRELEVVDLLREGMSQKEAAAILDRSQKTVSCHMSSVYRKIGVKNRNHMLSMATHFDPEPPRPRPMPKAPEPMPQESASELAAQEPALPVGSMLILPIGR